MAKQLKVYKKDINKEKIIDIKKNRTMLIIKLFRKTSKQLL